MHSPNCKCLKPGSRGGYVYQVFMADLPFYVCSYVLHLYCVNILQGYCRRRALSGSFRTFQNVFRTFSGRFNLCAAALRIMCVQCFILKVLKPAQTAELQTDSYIHGAGGLQTRLTLDKVPTFYLKQFSRTFRSAKSAFYISTVTDLPVSDRLLHVKYSCYITDDRRGSGGLPLDVLQVIFLEQSWATCN